jgi:hypothetical protein
MTAAVESCAWCGAAVDPDDGFRAYDPPGARRAVFCRLEHVVPWAIQGAHWEAGEPEEPLPAEGAPPACAWCEKELDEVRVVLLRHRGEHRIRDDFCSADHLLDWAKAGGRWR